MNTKIGNKLMLLALIGTLTLNSSVIALADWHSEEALEHTTFSSEEQTEEEVTTSTEEEITDSSESIDEEQEETTPPEVKEKAYTTIHSETFNLWSDASLSHKINAADYLNQTVLIQETRGLADGRTSVSLVNHQGKLIGYANQSDLQMVTGEQGIYQATNQYVAINGLYAFWDGFEWKKSSSSAPYVNQTFRAMGTYYHFSGETYLSIYDNEGTWLGYINQSGVEVLSGAQGKYQAVDQYVSLNGQYTLWDSFEWTKGSSSAPYANQTFRATAKYQHFNGSTYLSIYNNEGAWLGYINQAGTIAAQGAQGAQGAYSEHNQFVTVNGRYDFWDGFGFEKSTSSKPYANQTFHATAIYSHFNGSRYLSVYDNQGKWLGYINENGVTAGTGQQGSYQSYGKRVTVITNGYTVWRDFSWDKKASGNFKGKTYLAKGVYHHFNGSRYLSLYDKNKWIGYINEDATTNVRGAASFLGTTREKVVNELTRNTSMYANTPYRSLSTSPYRPDLLMVPQGRPNGKRPGFNCTGFVAAVLQNSGAQLNKITNVANAWGGIANAYNWRDALKPRTDYLRFSSVSELLASGAAKKGDIIYFEADFSKPNADCHIGIFWGNSSNDDKIFHSTIIAPGGTNITNIKAYTPCSEIILIPMD